MRFVAFALLGLVLSGPAAAQNWQEYDYPEYKFSVMFPAAPRIETTRHEVAAGRSVPARVYSVRQDKSEFTMIVADLTNTGLNYTGGSASTSGTSSTSSATSSVTLSGVTFRTRTSP